MRLNKQETEAVEYLRAWVAEGCPMRVDGSFPTDFLTVIRRLGQVPEEIPSRTLEDALIAAPDLDVRDPALVRRQQLTKQIFMRVRSAQKENASDS